MFLQTARDRSSSVGLACILWPPARLWQVVVETKLSSKQRHDTLCSVQKTPLHCFGIFGHCMALSSIPNSFSSNNVDECDQQGEDWQCFLHVRLWFRSQGKGKVNLNGHCTSVTTLQDTQTQDVSVQQMIRSDFAPAPCLMSLISDRVGLIALSLRDGLSLGNLSCLPLTPLARYPVTRSWQIANGRQLSSRFLGKIALCTH